MKNERMNNEKRIATLEYMENNARGESKLWEKRAFCANNYEDAKQFMIWAIKAEGEKAGYYFARSLWVDKDYCKDMYDLKVDYDNIMSYYNRNK